MLRRRNREVCAFCGQPRTEERRLVAGPGLYICGRCVGLCAEILKEPATSNTHPFPDLAEMSDDDLLAHLPNMVSAADQADANLVSYVGELRRRGVSWTRIGDALGIARQSAWERFAQRMPVPDRS